MLKAMKVIKFANVLILNPSDEVLILRRTSSHPTRPLMLDLPGGGVESNESFKETIVREVREETGIRILPEKLELIWNRKQNLPDRNIHGVIFKIRIDTSNCTINLSNEHDRYFWMRAKDLNGLSDFHKECIE